MKNRYLLLCITGLLVASCSIQEMDTASNRRSRDSFYARIESPCQTETKAFVDDRLRVLWDESDHVSIFDKYTYNQEYRFTGNTGDNAGTFDIIETGDFITGNELDLVYSVYPYDKENRIDNDGVLSVTLPDHQTYRENSFGAGANTMVSCTTGSELMFKNLCGYLMLKLYGDDVTISSLSIQGNGEEGIAGRAHVYSSPGGAPSVTLNDSATRDITIAMDQAVRLGSSASDATIFWVVIPPVTFTQGFMLIAKGENGATYWKTTSKSIPIERNTITHMAPLKMESGGNILVSSISLDKTTLTLMQGSSETLHATILPEMATDKTVTWTSSSTDVATVSGGTVSALAPGTATITASAGGKIATCEVTVEEPPIETLVRASFTNTDISSGSMSYEGSFVKFTSGVKLGVRLTNGSTKTIRLTGLRLICGKTGQKIDYSVSEIDIPGGSRAGYTVTLAGTFYSPTVVFTYQYENNSYSASANYSSY